MSRVCTCVPRINHTTRHAIPYHLRTGFSTSNPVLFGIAWQWMILLFIFTHAVNRKYFLNETQYFFFLVMKYKLSITGIARDMPSDALRGNESRWANVPGAKVQRRKKSKWFFFFCFFYEKYYRVVDRLRFTEKKYNKIHKIQAFMILWCNFFFFSANVN